MFLYQYVFVVSSLISFQKLKCHISNGAYIHYIVQKLHSKRIKRGIIYHETTLFLIWKIQILSNGEQYLGLHVLKLHVIIMS